MKRYNKSAIVSKHDIWPFRMWIKRYMSNSYFLIYHNYFTLHLHKNLYTGIYVYMQLRFLTNLSDTNDCVMWGMGLRVLLELCLTFVGVGGMRGDETQYMMNKWCVSGNVRKYRIKWFSYLKNKFNSWWIPRIYLYQNILMS